MTQPRSPKWRRRIQRSASLGLAVGATLALLEAGVRMMRLAPPLALQHGANVSDPGVPYKRRPRSILRGRSKSDEYDFEYRHNALGFRDRTHTPEKPPGVLRILALGDSFTYGEGADFEETWISRLEQLLNERPGQHPRVEAIRMGLPRYFPEAESLVLEHYGLRFAPDLVIVAVLPNDVIDTHLGLDEISVDPSGFLRSRAGRRVGEPGRWLFIRSHLARVLLRRWAAFERQRVSPFVWADVYREGGQHEDDWQRMETDLESMLAKTRARAAELVLLSIPQQGPWDAEKHYPDQRLGAWSARHRVPFVASLPELERASQTQSVYWQRDGHCTAAGYDVIARVVTARLTDSDLVP